MAEKTLKTKNKIGGSLVTIFFGLPWLEIAAELWQLGRRLWRGLAHEGLYEVLDHAATLELLDSKGKRALIRKRQKVRYLQNNIIAYQDQAWGDGEILLKYRCSPGVEADRYQAGHRTHVLISLRQVRERGDVDEFRMQWQQRDGYLRSVEEWGSGIDHKTKRLQLQVIFPTRRPPQQVFLVQQFIQRTTPLPLENVRMLPDGR